MGSPERHSGKPTPFRSGGPGGRLHASRRFSSRAVALRRSPVTGERLPAPWPLRPKPKEKIPGLLSQARDSVQAFPLPERGCKAPVRSRHRQQAAAARTQLIAAEAALLLFEPSGPTVPLAQTDDARPTQDRWGWLSHWWKRP